MPESTEQRPKLAGSTEHNTDLRPANRDTADSPVPWRTRAAIVSIGMLSFVGILIETSMTVDFPVLIRSMHVPLATVQWLATGYLLLVTIVMGSTAYLLKRFNPRALFFFALATSIIGSLICLVAPPDSPCCCSGACSRQSPQASPHP